VPPDSVGPSRRDVCRTLGQLDAVPTRLRFTALDWMRLVVFVLDSPT